ncbi:hypothetical protein ACQ4PT_064917 [Festuca glaucescens]
MASRHYVFADDVEIRPPRRPTPDRVIPPGLPPADGQDPPEGWTPIRIQCQYVTEPDGTPSTLLLYSRPCDAPQHHWPDPSTDDRPERYDGRRWSPEPRKKSRKRRAAGKVFLEYASLDHSIRCWEAMDGRWFARRQIVAGFYPEDMFAAGDYSCDGQN